MAKNPSPDDTVEILEMPDGDYRNLDGSPIEMIHHEDGLVTLIVNGVSYMQDMSDPEMLATFRRLMQTDMRFAANVAIIKAMYAERIKKP
jgi:hypothetical protein